MHHAPIRAKRSLFTAWAPGRGVADRWGKGMGPFRAGMGTGADARGRGPGLRRQYPHPPAWGLGVRQSPAGSRCQPSKATATNRHQLPPHRLEKRGIWGPTPGPGPHPVATPPVARPRPPGTCTFCGGAHRSTPDGPPSRPTAGPPRCQGTRLGRGGGRGLRMGNAQPAPAPPPSPWAPPEGGGGQPPDSSA